MFRASPWNPQPLDLSALSLSLICRAIYRVYNIQGLMLEVDHIVAPDESYTYHVQPSLNLKVIALNTALLDGMRIKIILNLTADNQNIANKKFIYNYLVICWVVPYGGLARDSGRFITRRGNLSVGFLCMLYGRTVT